MPPGPTIETSREASNSWRMASIAPVRPTTRVVPNGHVVAAQDCRAGVERRAGRRRRLNRSHESINRGCHSLFQILE
jgi:hypothetical protein